MENWEYPYTRYWLAHLLSYCFQICPLFWGAESYKDEKRSL